VATVCVCDDSPLARESLRRVVATVPGVDRVSAAASGEEMLARYSVERPDLVLADVRMPGIGGVEATRRLLAVHPGAAVIMLTMAEDTDGVARAVAHGARGYVRKDASREELSATLVQVLNGRSRAASVPARRGDGQGDPPSLSERELQVLSGMSRGRSNAEIGRELYLSEDTVKTHARRLFRKLGAADRAHAVAVGFRWGLVR
jgi:DNA-binding NarL/FixJ family response regulator